MAPRWLLVGAMLAETVPVLSRLSRARPRGPHLFQGWLHGVEVAVVTVGVGPDPAEARTRAALTRVEADRVLSFGTCGALVDGLPRGTLVHVDRLLLPEGGEAALVPLGSPARTLVTVRAGVWDRATREALAARGAQACEMEAAGVWAACAGRPLSALKVVSDLAGGAPDPILPARGKDRASRARVGLFMARASALVQQAIVPRLAEVLAGTG